MGNAVPRPIVIGIAISAALHVLYYYYSIVVLKRPPGRFPYWFSACGSLLLNWLPWKLYSDGYA
jgi:hypothetical protein